MTSVPALRNATLLAAIALLQVSTAHAIDPARSPRNTEPIVPTYNDPYGTLPGTYPGAPSKSFDPFAPQNGARQPGSPALGGTNSRLRVQPNVIPQPTQPVDPPRWRLGIFSTDTGTGVQIVRISDGNSPARRAGLEVDDTIVNVSGHQVGFLHGHRHELGQAFNQHADTDGYVELLVHDSRSGNLITLPVTLESRFERIRGTIGFQGARLPSNAVAHVALHEIVRNGVVTPLVTKTVRDIQTTPVEFVLDIDPSLVDPRRTYVVHADITANNRTIYTTRNEYRVITDGYPRTVDMRLYPTSTNSTVGYNGYADQREQQLDQISQWFRDYLHRDPYTNERSVWQSHVDRGLPLEDARADLLAHNEFYTQAQRDDRKYIQNMYQAVLGRQAQKAEIDAWVSRLEAKNGFRREIAREFLAAVSQQR